MERAGRQSLDLARGDIGRHGFVKLLLIPDVAMRSLYYNLYEECSLVRKAVNDEAVYRDALADN
jgi:hypothetical protein